MKWEANMRLLVVGATGATAALAGAAIIPGVLSGANGAEKAAEKLKVGFIYLGPVGDMGWTYQHEVGRQGLVKDLGDKVETTYLENVPEGPDAERAIEQLARAGNKLIFTTSFGYMEPTLKVAKKYPNVHFEHATGYKRDKNMAIYSGRFYEGRRARLYRLVPDSRGSLRHQRHHPGGADHQPEHQGQDHLGQHLVRPGQGSRCRQSADRSGRRRYHAAHGLSG